jgi:AcrR family transcriptional regulator
MDEEPGLRARRRAQTRHDIAAAAAALFARQGVAQVTAAQIADAAGVSLRTFYRYFDTKEQAVAPVLEIGAARWQELLASADGEARAAISAAIDEVLTVDGEDAAEQMLGIRPLLRALTDDTELRAVWHRVNHDSEELICGIIAEHEGWASDRLRARLLAVAATDAIRIGLEEWAASEAGTTGAGSPAQLARLAFDVLAPR